MDFDIMIETTPLLTILNHVEGQSIGADEITEDGLSPCWLTKDEIERTENYLADDWGSVAIVLEREDATRMFVVQSIDLEFLVSRP